MVRRIKRGWMDLRVVDKRRETHDTYTLYLVDNQTNGREFDYTPGQYLTFRFDGLASSTLVRSYTLSSSPCQEHKVAITVKALAAGVASQHLCDLQPGAVLRARGPIGRFGYDDKHDHPHLVMVAGGSGVTPFLSLLREYTPQLGEVQAPKRLSLLVSYRSRADLIAWDELTTLAKHPQVQVKATLSRDPAAASEFWQGRVTAAMLAAFCQDTYQQTTFFTCGPTPLMNLTQDFLLAAGVEPAHIKTESFSSS